MDKYGTLCTKKPEHAAPVFQLSFLELQAGEVGGFAQFFFAAELSVVLRHAVGPRRRAGFDLSGVQRHGQVGDGRVFGFARAVRHDIVTDTV